MTEAIATRGAQRVELPESAVADLRKAFDGEIIAPADTTYEAARHSWNGMVDKYPALVVQPRGTADVASAITSTRSTT